MREASSISPRECPERRARRPLQQGAELPGLPAGGGEPDAGRQDLILHIDTIDAVLEPAVQLDLQALPAQPLLDQRRVGLAVLRGHRALPRATARPQHNTLSARIHNLPLSPLSGPFIAAFAASRKPPRLSLAGAGVLAAAAPASRAEGVVLFLVLHRPLDLVHEQLLVRRRSPGAASRTQVTRCRSSFS